LALPPAPWTGADVTLFKRYGIYRIHKVHAGLEKSYVSIILCYQVSFLSVCYWLCQKFSNLLAGLFLFTDAIFAAIPLFFIRKLNIPLREKIVLGVLMALGLFCTTATIPKLLSMGQYASNPDYSWFGADLLMWSMIEVYIGIIAACIPTLRRLFESILRNYGLLSSHRSGGVVLLPELNLTNSHDNYDGKEMEEMREK
jgi:rhodopsin domain-containing protein